MPADTFDLQRGESPEYRDQVRIGLLAADPAELSDLVVADRKLPGADPATAFGQPGLLVSGGPGHRQHQSGPIQQRYRRAQRLGCGPGQSWQTAAFRY